MIKFRRRTFSVWATWTIKRGLDKGRIVSHLLSDHLKQPARKKIGFDRNRTKNRNRNCFRVFRWRPKKWISSRHPNWLNTSLLCFRGNQQKLPLSPSLSLSLSLSHSFFSLYLALLLSPSLFSFSLFFTLPPSLSLPCSLSPFLSLSLPCSLPLSFSLLPFLSLFLSLIKLIDSKKIWKLNSDPIRTSFAKKLLKLKESFNLGPIKSNAIKKIDRIKFSFNFPYSRIFQSGSCCWYPLTNKLRVQS